MEDDDEVPPAFALAPALHRADQPINYSNRTGQALYQQATAALPYTFEGKESSLAASFLLAVANRAAACAWMEGYLYHHHT